MRAMHVDGKPGKSGSEHGKREKKEQREKEKREKEQRAKEQREKELREKELREKEKREKEKREKEKREKEKGAQGEKGKKEPEEKGKKEPEEKGKKEPEEKGKQERAREMNDLRLYLQGMIPEVRVTVLSYLSPQDLLNTSQVSMAWRQSVWGAIKRMVLRGDVIYLRQSEGALRYGEPIQLPQGYEKLEPAKQNDFFRNVLKFLLTGQARKAPAAVDYKMLDSMDQNTLRSIIGVDAMRKVDLAKTYPELAEYLRYLIGNGRFKDIHGVSEPPSLNELKKYPDRLDRTMAAWALGSYTRT